ncbi:PPK2 family polyphosphate kinase [Allobranchiibius huperziae]|uniref:PPK2 family polyphosphate:nucleotide phosphotransferase n=1 Tax=Allobranchiibius huperziae TaxID=1874116 RepID=A0A853DFZ4_9MICO|nr:PPK2 family polyphosphate kinase [Allobranchiibius huperziae]NYJ74953.1 PPK2 family polyphosphate:nucleotide phosphotransferase [Allobranchiibius huperziae]
MGKKAAAKDLATTLEKALRVHQGFVLADRAPASTPGFTKGKKTAVAAQETTAAELDDLQERMYAESTQGGRRNVLLVVQGMDTSGKGGIMRHVVGSLDPQGVTHHAFKKPTREELSHPFLWRVRNALPPAGSVGVFDRSHYEDVLVARVHNLVPPATISRRYGQIDGFEQTLVDNGTTVIKVMLHVSREEQGERLAGRLDRVDKQWKFNPNDVDERGFWPAYQEAYQLVMDKTSTDAAPWYVVPADHKWYARLAVHHLLLHHLRAMDPQWPAPSYDVSEQKARLASS